MGNGKKHVYILLFAFITVSVLAWPANSSPKIKGNCHIQITLARKSGKSSFKTFHRKASSKEECAAMAEAHKMEFLPQNIEYKDVTHRFGDEEKRDVE